MRVALIAGVCSAVVLCGCANNRTMRSGATGGAGLPAAPGGASGLGLPAPSFPSQNNSSSYGPSSGGGPSLGLPEAFHDGYVPRSQRATRLEAPDPAPRAARNKPETSAGTVSTAGHPSIFDEPNWSRYYRSTDRRPMESVILGTGELRVAILASLHGDETQSVALVEELARALRRNPQNLRNARVLLVKNPNPDGFSGRSPYNIHNVDLNRNFPSANWAALKTGRSGARGASEKETQVIMRLLADFRPQLLVHLKDSRQGSVVNCEGDLDARAEQIGRLLSCQVVHGLGEKTSGSVENYALTKLGCPSLTLLLAREASDEAAWARNHDALLALMEQAPAASSGGESINTLEEQPDPFEEPPVHKSSLRRQRPAAAGNSASPQKARTRKPLPDFPAAIPDHGYIELPAP